MPSSDLIGRASRARTASVQLFVGVGAAARTASVLLGSLTVLSLVVTDPSAGENAIHHDVADGAILEHFRLVNGKLVADRGLLFLKRWPQMERKGGQIKGT